MAEEENRPLSRRSRAFVTKNACAECRRRKARCDGRLPCLRCQSIEGMTCRYAVWVRVSKDSMRADIEQLRKYRRMSENVLGFLALGQQSDFILQRLRGGQRLEDISTGLGAQVVMGKSSPDHSVFLSSTRSSRKESCSTAMRSSSEEYFSKSAAGPKRSRYKTPISEQTSEDYNKATIYSWTTVTTNQEIIKHLLSLYFCWEYPTFACLSKRHFIEDFRAGRSNYCSSLLVNAILCLSCRFSNHLHTGITSEKFHAESESLWTLEQDNPSLTTIQASNLMSYWEASCGRTSRSWFYARQSICMAVEMGLHTDLNDIETSTAEHKVRSITFWGTFALDQIWSLSMGVLPCISSRGVRRRPYDFTDTDDQSIWKPYTDTGLPIEQDLHQPSNFYWIYKGSCELSVIIHDSLHTLYSPRRVLTSREILKIYTEYLYWYDSLPTALRRGENSTPAVLFVHMYYHYAILLLFGPFLKVQFSGSSISPYEICVQAADAIMSLICSYRQIHTLCLTPSFVPYIALAADIVHLVATESTVSIGAPMKIPKSITHLNEMGLSHNFANRAGQILRVMVHILSVDLSHQCEEETQGETVIKSRLVAFFSSEMEHCLYARSLFKSVSIFTPFPAQTPPQAIYKQQLLTNGFILLGEKTCKQCN